MNRLTFREYRQSFLVKGWGNDERNVSCGLNENFIKNKCYKEREVAYEIHLGLACKDAVLFFCELKKNENSLFLEVKQ